jgi:hypothetical protein
MPPVGFDPTIPASARPQTYALVRAATGIGGSVATCRNEDSEGGNNRRMPNI